MTPEKWQELERLYLAALEREDHERAGFLHDACAGNRWLRDEVESLLEYHPRVTNFLEPADPAHDEQRPAVPEPHRASPAGRLAGRTFGAYELQKLIAVGGMGEVYRAVDTQLRRTVAIKVLPEHFSDHPERRERFKREAMLISSLNHPHICGLYHVGTHDGLDYLVMEHLDGETLHGRLKLGRMKCAEALQYSIQIASALDAAHRQGIVHRDLKPANVILTKVGAKVLDFGLAARRGPPQGAAPDPPLDGSTGLTGEGRIMGTVPYMSPEQLQGRPVDARTDIFAFGALAYEMFSGTPAFAADSQAGLIGAILKDDPPPIAASRADLPPLLAVTLERCLAKDPRERWQTATDLLFQLRSIDESARTPPWGSRPGRFSGRMKTAVGLAAIVACVVVGASQGPGRGTGGESPPATTAGPIRFPLLPPEGTTFPSSFDVPFALSPDGRRIAYVASDTGGTRHLWLQALDSERHQLLAGTEGASSPFWSPDSEWIAFFAGGSLKKVRVTSPITQVIASPAWSMAGAAWSRKDVIVFPGGGGLLRVSADGGPVTRVADDASFHLWPRFLDDSDHYIYSSFTPRRLLLGSLAHEPPRELMTFPVNVSALAYVPGYVLFVQDSVLFARPFDEQRREFTGGAQRILDGIPVSGPGRAPFSASSTGVLAFWTEAVGTPAVLRWVTRSGDAVSAIEAPAKYFGFSVSPDGRELAVSRVGKNGGPDLWVRNLGTGVETQLTFDGLAWVPRWSPDSSRLLFTGITDRPPPTMFVKHARQPDAAQSLGASSLPLFASSWSGNVMLGVTAATGGLHGNDILMQRVDSNQRERVAVDSDANETEGTLSPNGDWVAYTTDQTGRNEVWVADFPFGKLRRQVSAGGGTSPHWCGGQNELVYIAGRKHLVAVPFRGSARAIELGDQQRLFPTGDLVQFDRTLVPTANYYAAASDCQRFLLATRAPDPQASPIRIIVNWQASLVR